MDKRTSTKKISLEEVSEDWFLKNFSANDGRAYAFLKRLTDLFFAFIGFILLIFLYPVFGLIIKMGSSGNVLYKQERVGKNGKTFYIYKFRTMYENGREHKEVWREKNKDSVTKFGKFLRWTHLDELPQAYNLLMGELSFVGPRAEWSELAKIFEKEIPFYKKRYLIKPGMMGWAQINFPASRSVKEAREKFEYDLYYIKNRSLILDLEIILKSIKLYFF